MGANRRLPARSAALIALAVGLLVAGCGGESPTVASPTTTRDPCAVRTPLLLDLHGYSEHADGHESVVGWRPFAEEHGFLAITPQAAGDPPAWDLDADVATIEQVIDDAVLTQCADPDRVYVTGYSMGGMLISHLACRLPDRIAAVAPVAGIRPVEPCEPARSVPALIMHGTADDTVLFEGGLNPAAADALEMPVEGPSVIAMAQAWAVRNGCEADPEVAAGALDQVTVHRYPCPAGADVELHVIDEGTHGWPRFANDVIWRFLEQHSLD